MNLDSGHPGSTLSPAPASMPSMTVHEDDMDDELSDSDLSQFQAEIERNLSSASPETSPQNVTTEHVSDEHMDVDSEEDVKFPGSSKSRKRANMKEYYDPELFGLRRSVSCFYPGEIWVS